VINIIIIINSGNNNSNNNNNNNNLLASATIVVGRKHFIKWLYIKSMHRDAWLKISLDRSWSVNGLKVLIKKINARSLTLLIFVAVCISATSGMWVDTVTSVVVCNQCFSHQHYILLYYYCIFLLTLFDLNVLFFYL